MQEGYFSDQRRVRAIILTGRKSIILIKQQRHDEEPLWIAPGGDVTSYDEDDNTALHRELMVMLGAEVHIETLALELFMSRWNFYLCRLRSIHRSKRADAKGAYSIVEVPLEEKIIRKLNIQPRALRDYLMAHLEELKK